MVISGIVSATDLVDVKIGTFSSDYWFMADYFGGEDVEDVVDSEFSASSGEVSPISYVESGSDGTYSIELPGDVTSMGDLICWVDSDGDEAFDLGRETGYFPKKEIDGTLYVVSFCYVLIGDESTYLIGYQNNQNTSQNTDIEIVGYTGYNFTVD